VLKAVAKLAAVAKAAGKSVDAMGPTADTAREEGVELCGKIFNLITMHTMFTLLRLPDIRSNARSEQRSVLKQLYDDYNDSKSGITCYPEHLLECKEILVSGGELREDQVVAASGDKAAVERPQAASADEGRPNAAAADDFQGGAAASELFDEPALGRGRARGGRARGRGRGKKGKGR
jgi:hypothetical protein